MEDKKEKKMSDRMFLHKAGTKAGRSAAAFIQAHQEYLLSGSLKKLTEPILVALDKGEALPTPSMELLRGAVYQHMLDSMIQEGINKMMQKEEGAGSSSHSTSKAYLATVYNAKDEVQTYFDTKGEEHDLVKGFDDGMHGRDWVDRRLVEGFTDWYGTVVHQTITVGGEPWQEIVLRADSIARILKKKKNPVMHERGKSTNSLSFGVKAHQDRASFSKG